MLTKRIIACMDVRDGQVVKGVQFQQLRHAGASLGRDRNTGHGVAKIVFVRHDEIGDFHQAGFRALDFVTEFRGEDDDDVIGNIGNIDVILNVTNVQTNAFVNVGYEAFSLQNTIGQAQSLPGGVA